MKLKIKKGAKVEVITGADKGRQGTVLAVNAETMRIRIEGVKMQTRHSKQDGLVKSEGYIHYSNVKLVEAATAAKKKTAKKGAKEKSA
ncbi:MAG: 50S ribosomal protein L24 [Bdellovibrionota bacterium]